MFRPALMAPTTHSSQRWQETWARLLAPLTLWICVSVSLRYGYYGDCRMVLGPSSSRLLTASSVFVEQVEVRDDAKRGVSFYAFSEKPELSYQANWSVSNYYEIVGSYGHKGYSLWLNQGSTIRMRWETHSRFLNQLEVAMIKGERNIETLMPKVTSSPDINEARKVETDPNIWTGKEAKYTIEEDDKYYLRVINTNPKNVIMTLSVNVSAKMYDITKAKSMCSTIKGSCRLSLLFPNTHYVILTTPNNGDLGGGWYLELSFVARVITYIAILGFVVIIIFLILKYLGACDNETSFEDTPEPVPVREVTETHPILPVKPTQYTYGTCEEEDDDSGASTTSEELYDAKLCVICYDEQRNCFFVPCGHCATCYDCAQRIMEGENKVCPICRRLVHKVRRLFNP